MYISHILNLKFTFHCLEYTSSTILHFVTYIISVPCYPVQLQLVNLDITIQITQLRCVVHVQEVTP